MALSCPVCKSDMQSFDVPDGFDSSHYIDLCPRGCGRWYDAREYSAIDPRLADPKVRAALTQGRPAANASGTTLDCPRCERSTLTPVEFVGATLCLCAQCQGVWAPHGAVDAVIKGLSLHKAVDGGTLRNHYRNAAQSSVMQDNGVVRTPCASCKVMVPFDEAAISEVGIVCRPCAARVQAEEAWGYPESAPPRGLLTLLRAALKDLTGR
jgi:Zn-finger nucleic acid-binding protein